MVTLELGAFDPDAKDAATVTLRRHYGMIRDACRGLLRKVDSFDGRHMEVLFAAASCARDPELSNAEHILCIYDRLTRPFELARDETFANELRRPAPAVDFEKHRPMLLSLPEFQALRSYRAAAAEVPTTLQ